LAFPETIIYVTDTAGERRAWLTDWLQGVGVPEHRFAPNIADLLRQLRGLQNKIGDRPALAIITTEALDQPFLDFCHRCQRLNEEARLGLIAVVYGAPPEPDAVRKASAAGCLDTFHASEQPVDGVRARWMLALHLLHERHLRVMREQMYQAQLAQLRVAEARLQHRATHDDLTDLANRRAFENALDLALEQAAQRQLTHALMYLDLDRFKLHNDAAGHESGDHLLRLVGNLLRSVLAPEYLLSRLGSDEFAVLLQGVDEQQALDMAERLRASVAAIEPDGEQVVYHVAVSVGVAIIGPQAAHGASQVLAQAEQACYVAKTRGGNAVHRFSEEDGTLQHLREDMRWSRTIRRALAENRFFLVFQPVLAIAEDRISHFEALLRIPTAFGGDGLSASFITAAERLGLARQIDLWTVDNAIDFLALQKEITLAVNLSSHAFQEQALLPLLQEKLQSTAIAPERLTFEITETAAIVNFAETRRMIGEIRNLGCRFALDDFGSGFSSYNYIKQFPVDDLKIDGSFIFGLREDKRDQAIVKSMVDIGHGLGKGVVAECIENAETLRLLMDMGIDYAQGYYIGRPSEEPVGGGFLQKCGFRP
jgi:diguanylate cyclase (GGDEF)-like protein